MKTDLAVAEKLSDKETITIVDLHNWLRIVGDRHHTLALIPTGISKQGYKRLAEYCAKMAG